MAPAMKSVRENTPKSGKRRPPEAAPSRPRTGAVASPPPVSAPPAPAPPAPPPPPPPAEEIAPPSDPTLPEGLPPDHAVASPSPAERGDAWSYEIASAEASSDLTPVVGSNLRRLRIKRGLSLEKLSRASSVSRAMLGQIELGQSTPTINVLWKIARALGVPFSALITNRAAGRTTVMSAERAKVLTSHDGTFTSRALFPFDEPRTVEFYEFRLSPRSVEQADPHPPGTVENLVV